GHNQITARLSSLHVANRRCNNTRKPADCLKVLVAKLEAVGNELDESRNVRTLNYSGDQRSFIRPCEWVQDRKFGAQFGFDPDFWEAIPRTCAINKVLSLAHPNGSAGGSGYKTSSFGQ